MVKRVLSVDYQHSPAHMLRLYRVLMVAAAVGYLGWWELVELSLPGSFNPFLSRLAVSVYALVVFALSFVSPWVRRRLGPCFASCLWLVTLHYFYLFRHNDADINWVVGTYITVIAACACLQSERGLVAYSMWTLVLALLLSFAEGHLQNTIFLPGLITILVFAYVGLRTRLQLLGRSRERSEWFQNLFGAVFEGIVLHDGGVVVDANDAFAKIFGYELGEVIGMRIENFVAPAERALVRQKIVSMTEAHYEVSGQKKDGTLISAEIRGKKHTVQGRSLRLAAVSDITARKKSERDRVLYESSQSAIRMRDEFLSIASHELKTPLTNIKLQTQLAARAFKKDGALPPETLQKFIDQTERQCDRLNRLVEEMLDTSSIAAGKLHLERQEFDLADLVRDVGDAFEGSLRQSGSTLEIAAPRGAHIRGDRFRIEQVVSNLLSNAIKYGDRKPIRIEVMNLGPEVRLVISDKGIGIPTQDRERIFQRFERAVPSRRISGLGLGLYIARHLIEAHGGRIAVASGAGQGTRFTVSLPAAAVGREVHV